MKNINSIRMGVVAVLALGIAVVAYASLDTTGQAWGQQDFNYSPGSAIKGLIAKSGPVCDSCLRVPGSECYKKCVDKPSWSQGLIFYTS